MKLFHYKNYLGSIEINLNEKCLHGKLMFVNDLVTYEAQTIKTLEKEFHSAIDDYLATCKKLKREPMRPFRGSLNVRIGEELHKNIATTAALHNMTINEYIKTALQNQLAKEKSH